MGRDSHGKAILAPASHLQKNWQMNVAWTFLQSQWGRMVLLEGPIRLTIHFTVLRPKSQYRTGKYAGEPNPNKWQEYPHRRQTGDLTKLVRATEDSLTGRVYKDDKQIVEQITSIGYGEKEGAIIKIEEIEA